MEDLVRWLNTQLDEDERIARAATPGPWRQHDTHLGQYGHTATVLSGEGNDTELRAWLPTMSHESWDEARNVWNDAVHIAEWDPARVLREIDAKRQIIDEHRPDASGDCATCARLEDFDEDSDGVRTWSRSAKPFPCPTLRLLATVYVDRPGYLESWRP